MESQTGMRALGFAKRISGKQPRFRYFTTMPGNHASNRIHPEAIDGKQEWSRRRQVWTLDNRRGGSENSFVLSNVQT